MTAKKVTVIIATFLAVTLMSSGLFISDDNSAEPIELTDSLGKKITIDAPVDHVITLGVGFTQTVMELGYESKIAATDNYAKAKFTELDVVDLGNVYSAGNMSTMSLTIKQMDDRGLINKDSLLIIAPNYTSVKGEGGLIELLGSEYKVVVLATTVYDEVAEAVNIIGKAVGADGGDSRISFMTSLKDYLSNTVTDSDLSGYAMHISSTGKVYNRSLITSMMDIINVTNAGYDSKKTDASYPSDKSEIVQLATAHAGTVVFIDSGNPMTADEYKKEFFGDLDVRVVKLDASWNNIAPSIVDGLMAVMLNMYPEHYGLLENVPDNGNEGGDWLLYVCASVAVVAIIALAAVLLLKRN